MKRPSSFLDHVAYVTSVDLVDNRRAHALQMMKNGYAWSRISRRFQLFANLTFDHWCRWDPLQVIHHYGLPQPMAITPLPLQDVAWVSLYDRLVALRCRWQQVTLAYCRNYEAAWWLCRQGVPTLLESHGIPPNARHVAQLPVLCRLPAFLGLVTITPPLQTMFEQAGVPGEKILVTPDGVDLHRFQHPMDRQQARQQLGLPQGSPLAVYAGHLYEGRGVAEIVQAAALLPQVQFIMVGGMAAHVAHWQQASRDQGLTNLHWLGHVANALLPPYLWAADMLLMPYNSHCPTAAWMSPMKLFEYMAAGRVVVASDLPALHPVLRHGENGWLVACDDGVALAAGIRSMLEQESLASSLAEQARGEVARYDWQVRVAQIVSWLEQKRGQPS